MTTQVDKECTNSVHSIPLPKWVFYHGSVHSFYTFLHHSIYTPPTMIQYRRSLQYCTDYTMTVGWLVCLRVWGKLSQISLLGVFKTSLLRGAWFSEIRREVFWYHKRGSFAPSTQGSLSAQVQFFFSLGGPAEPHHDLLTMFRPEGHLQHI